VAQAELVTLYGDLSQACTTIDASLNGVTLTPGVYCVPAAATNLTTTLTLNGSGSFILRFASTFITSTGSQVLLTGGATCAGVAYQVGSSATLGGTVTGNVVALTSITMTGATLTGRALARNGAVTLTTTTASNGGC
jgi:type VI secretion system secreted protein VgrG